MTPSMLIDVFTHSPAGLFLGLFIALIAFLVATGGEK